MCQEHRTVPQVTWETGIWKSSVLNMQTVHMDTDCVGNSDKRFIFVKYDSIFKLYFFVIFNKFELLASQDSYDGWPSCLCDRALFLPNIVVGLGHICWWGSCHALCPSH